MERYGHLLMREVTMRLDPVAIQSLCLPQTLTTRHHQLFLRFPPILLHCMKLSCTFAFTRSKQEKVLMATKRPFTMFALEHMPERPEIGKLRATLKGFHAYIPLRSEASALMQEHGAKVHTLTLRTCQALVWGRWKTYIVFFGRQPGIYQNWYDLKTSNVIILIA